MVRLSSYKFIIILGLLDSSQLVIHAMSGVFTIAQSTFDPQLNKVKFDETYLSFVLVLVLAQAQANLSFLILDQLTD